MSFLAFWTHDLSPFLIQFNETLGIRYYGLAYVISFIGAAFGLEWYARRGRSPLAVDKVWDLMVVLIIGVMVGGRVGSFLLYHPEELIHDPVSFFRVWEGGMASHGGFAGVMIALAWFAKRQGLSFFALGDCIVSLTPLGLMLVRIANFINGELWGKVSDVPWAVIFPSGGAEPRHPSQLYEAVLEGALLLIYVQWRFWRTTITTRHPGSLSGEFLVGYACARIVCEVFREPDADLIFGLSRGTFYSLFIAVLGVVLIAWTRRSRLPVGKR